MCRGFVDYSDNEKSSRSPGLENQAGIRDSHVQRFLTDTQTNKHIHRVHMESLPGYNRVDAEKQQFELKGKDDIKTTILGVIDHDGLLKDFSFADHAATFYGGPTGDLFRQEHNSRV